MHYVNKDTGEHQAAIISRFRPKSDDSPRSEYADLHVFDQCGTTIRLNVAHLEIAADQFPGNLDTWHWPERFPTVCPKNHAALVGLSD